MKKTLFERKMEYLKSKGKVKTIKGKYGYLFIIGKKASFISGDYFERIDGWVSFKVFKRIVDLMAKDLKREIKK